MKCAFWVLSMVLLLAGSLSAGQNPDVRAYIDMDPPNHVNRANPAASTIVDVYLCCDSFSVGGGLWGVSLVVDITAGGFVAGAPDVTVFHPSAQTVIGGPDNLVNGWVIAAPECVFPDASNVVKVARIPFFYTGPAGDFDILASPIDGKAAVDCNNEIDIFCVATNGGLNQDPSVPGDVGCLSAVEPVSWGSIKALYR
jgi:hypothetical protein